MNRVEQYRRSLRRLPSTGWPAYLSEHSGLPGPRGNIELAKALAEEADPSVLDALLSGEDEYLVFCGVVGLGRRLADGAAGADGDLEHQLHAHASDGRWRVREAVAMALQRLGDTDPARMFRLCAIWAGDPDPLVQRAAVAGVCEPRLLDGPDAARVAVDICELVTRSLAARPREERRRPEVRVLRRGLGYCWSVAVAADPRLGLPRLRALLDSPDPDVGWIVRENLSKARLSRLL
ncbi:HEAT repeat domain-containing protein [Actinotalea sp. K2]|uniref:HEAT repeat domain-containing protein n=1 Tax=Actinotalea sp. K2 TaxID=2939438 RepID=UPI0020178B45|nr:HEAT repeat domain-containing protein [Actinotalea sp. K2]MCL3862296.1 HEAT repeat domain-containing protein [Actinotalea sp. K2]